MFWGLFCWSFCWGGWRQTRVRTATLDAPALVTAIPSLSTLEPPSLVWIISEASPRSRRLAASRFAEQLRDDCTFELSAGDARSLVALFSSPNEDIAFIAGIMLESCAHSRMAVQVFQQNPETLRRLAQVTCSLERLLDYMQGVHVLDCMASSMQDDDWPLGWTALRALRPLMTHRPVEDYARLRIWQRFCAHVTPRADCLLLA